MIHSSSLPKLRIFSLIALLLLSMLSGPLLTAKQILDADSPGTLVVGITNPEDWSPVKLDLNGQSIMYWHHNFSSFSTLKIDNIPDDWIFVNATLDGASLEPVAGDSQSIVIQNGQPAGTVTVWFETVLTYDQIGRQLSLSNGWTAHGGDVMNKGHSVVFVSDPSESFGLFRFDGTKANLTNDPADSIVGWHGQTFSIVNNSVDGSLLLENFVVTPTPGQWQELRYDFPQAVNLSSFETIQVPIFFVGDSSAISCIQFGLRDSSKNVEAWNLQYLDNRSWTLVSLSLLKPDYKDQGFRISDLTSFYLSALTTTNSSFLVSLDNITIVRQPFHSLIGGYLQDSLNGINILRQPYLLVNIRGDPSISVHILLNYSVRGWVEIGSISIPANDQYTCAILNAQTWAADSVVSGLVVGLDSTSNSSQTFQVNYLAFAQASPVVPASWGIVPTNGDFASWTGGLPNGWSSDFAAYIGKSAELTGLGGGSLLLKGPSEIHQGGLSVPTAGLFLVTYLFWRNPGVSPYNAIRLAFSDGTKLWYTMNHTAAPSDSPLDCWLPLPAHSNKWAPIVIDVGSDVYQVFHTNKIVSEIKIWDEDSGSTVFVNSVRFFSILMNMSRSSSGTLVSGKNLLLDGYYNEPSSVNATLEFFEGIGFHEGRFLGGWNTIGTVQTSTDGNILSMQDSSAFPNINHVSYLSMNTQGVDSSTFSYITIKFKIDSREGSHWTLHLADQDWTQTIIANESTPVGVWIEETLLWHRGPVLYLNFYETSAQSAYSGRVDIDFVAFGKTPVTNLDSHNGETISVTIKGDSIGYFSVITKGFFLNDDSLMIIEGAALPQGFGRGSTSSMLTPSDLLSIVSSGPNSSTSPMAQVAQMWILDGLVIIFIITIVVYSFRERQLEDIEL